MAKLHSKYRDSLSSAPLLKNELHIAEGGFDTDEMLTAFNGQLGTPEKAIQLGMKLEAQAFDLYCRLARKHSGTQTASFYQDMAGEERHHLQRLATELDALLTVK